MKGFGIYIKNDLLEPKHREAMGIAIWEYMWCIDKMTSINESGIGNVLGGKPVKSTEIATDLGTSRRHISENLQKLQSTGYINLKRTPYGYIITVNKAKKKFNAKKEMAEKVSSVEVEIADNVTSDGGKGNIQMAEKPTNKEDKTKRQDSRQDNITSKQSLQKTRKDQDIIDLIEAFKEINPSYKGWYGNKTQRGAAERLLKETPLEKFPHVIEAIKWANETPYAPTITTPLQLENKLANLRSAWIKENKKLSNNPSLVKI